MKRMLAIFAHPDDETAVAGTMAYYARQGVCVSLICTTKGEAGEISDPSLATPEDLGTVREAELRCACDMIGISALFLLGYCDSGMDGTPENEKETAFIQADPEEVRFRLVKLMRRIQPHIVITFEPKGWYGHPDHIAAGRYATEAFHLSGNPEAYRNAGPTWQPERLFYSAFLRSRFKILIDYAREQGLDTTNFDGLSFDEPDLLEGQITHVRDVTDEMEIKGAAMRCHQTQFGEDSLFLKVPPEIQFSTMGEEHFIQVVPDLVAVDSIAADLFGEINE
jgi:LmbE family N-acetylglucosaminyl deacetylase